MSKSNANVNVTVHGLDGYVTFDTSRDIGDRKDRSEELTWAMNQSVTNMEALSGTIDEEIAALKNGDFEQNSSIWSEKTLKNETHAANEDTATLLNMCPPSVVAEMDLSDDEKEYLTMAGALKYGCGLTGDDLETALKNFYELSPAERSAMAEQFSTMGGELSAEDDKHGSSNNNNNDLSSIQVDYDTPTDEQANAAYFLLKADSDTIDWLNSADAANGDTAVLDDIMSGDLDEGSLPSSYSDDYDAAKLSGSNYSDMAASGADDLDDILKSYVLNQYNDLRAENGEAIIGASMSADGPAEPQTNFMENIGVSSDDAENIYKLAQILSGLDGLDSTQQAELFRKLTDGTAGVETTNLSLTLEAMAEDEPTMTSDDVAFIEDTFLGDDADTPLYDLEGPNGIDNSEVLYAALSGDGFDDAVDMNYYAQLTTAGATYDSSADGILTEDEAQDILDKFSVDDDETTSGLAAAMANGTLSTDQATLLSAHLDDDVLTDGDVANIQTALSMSGIDDSDGATSVAEAQMAIDKFSLDDDEDTTDLAEAMYQGTLTADQAALLNAHRNDDGVTDADRLNIDRTLEASGYNPVELTEAQVDTLILDLGLDGSDSDAPDPDALKTAILSGALSSSQATWLNDNQWNDGVTTDDQDVVASALETYGLDTSGISLAEAETAVSHMDLDDDVTETEKNQLARAMVTGDLTYDQRNMLKLHQVDGDMTKSDTAVVQSALRADGYSTSTNGSNTTYNTSESGTSSSISNYNNPNYTTEDPTLSECEDTLNKLDNFDSVFILQYADEMSSGSLTLDHANTLLRHLDDSGLSEDDQKLIYSTILSSQANAEVANQEIWDAETENGIDLDNDGVIGSPWTDGLQDGPTSEGGCIDDEDLASLMFEVMQDRCEALDSSVRSYASMVQDKNLEIKQMNAALEVIPTDDDDFSLDTMVTDPESGEEMTLEDFCNEHDVTIPEHDGDTLSTEQCATLRTSITNRTNSLTSDSQLAMTQLQTAMNKYEQAVSALTNFMNSWHEMMMEVLQHM
ncbi:MAG: hypothetical protein AAF763_09430 [Pseudomonadota bacterium]